MKSRETEAVKLQGNGTEQWITSSFEWFVVIASLTLAISLLVVATKYPSRNMEALDDAQQLGEWSRKILVGGESYIDTRLTPSILDEEIAIEDNNVFQW